jgi:hypothetical protein
VRLQSRWDLPRPQAVGHRRLPHHLSGALYHPRQAIPKSRKSWSRRLAGQRRCDSLHHQQAEAGCDRGWRLRELFVHGARRSERSAAQAFINLPLIPDRLAFRAVIYDDRRGGYINNVPGTFTRQPTDGGIVSYFGGVVPTNSQTLSNANVAGNAINPVTYTGVRGSLYYKFNDDWNDQDLFSREEVTVIKRDLI